MADHILGLHQGELVEQGSHEQLLAENGRYAQMFNTQAKAVSVMGLPTSR